MKPIASLSLDLDNQWSYMKTRGDDAWESMPSYLDIVVPRVIEVLERLDLKITFFIVGQDAALERNHPALRLITENGHEVGNHSFRHEPWLHLYTPDELETEIANAEAAIEAATGQKPDGFRGPGFSLSSQTLETLKVRGYRYDCSTFPTFLGPVARAYYFFTAKLASEEKEQRKQLFGSFKEGFRPLKPYSWRLANGQLTEIPVTTMPIFRVPFHLSYLGFLAGYSPWVSRVYFRTALRLCRWTGVAPSVLLHPLDFLGSDDGLEPLSFFPGMNIPAAKKVSWAEGYLRDFSRSFDVGPMSQHAAAIEQQGALTTKTPDFPGGEIPPAKMA
jgi:hypothetical protein